MSRLITLQELNGDLQNLCHEGWSNSNIVVKVLDGFYKIKELKQYETPNGNRHFIIDTEPYYES